MSRTVKNVIYSFIVLFAGALIVAGAVAHFSPRSEAGTLQSPVLVSQPQSASVVATQLNCGDYIDQGRPEFGGAVDYGVCWIKNKKYGIDTFASKSARDSWLKIATPLGVVPTWETDTSVAYPARH